MKMAIVLRNDLGMGKGKLVAQGAHAAVECFIIAKKMIPNKVEEWLREGQKKIVLKVNSEQELLDIYNKSKSLGIPTSLIRDAGKTQLTPGTLTAVALLEKDDIVDRVTGHLKLL